MSTLISGKYEVLSQLGAGGMGVVYKVRHTTLETILALKTLPADLTDNPDLITRFNREARMMARLKHPNIVRIIDFDFDGSLYYLVMEYIEGRTLKQYVHEQGALPLVEVLDIAHHAAKALEFAHNHAPPIIHRDIKPANIMIEEPSRRVVVMDFGIAKELGPSELEQTQAGVIVGTVKYSSPEQLRHESLDGSADVYSLGMVMYELYTGRQFFAGMGETTVIGKVLYDPEENDPRFTISTPEVFVALVTKTIAKDHKRRYQRMEDFLHDLEVCRKEIELSDVTAILPSLDNGQESQGEHTQIAEEQPPRPAATVQVQPQEASKHAVQMPVAAAPAPAKSTAPAPAATPKPPPSPAPLQSSLLWPGVAVAVLAAGLLFFFWPSTSEKKALPTPLPKVVSIAEVQAAIAPLTCANISVAAIQNGAVSLQGRVESEAQRQEVRQKVATLPGVATVQDTLTIIPRPFCQVIAMLTPLQQSSAENSSGLRIQPRKGCDATYYRNEHLIIEVTAQQPLQYVYVDYYVADKEAVAHLLPNPKQPNNRLNGASAVTIGGADSKAQWQIDPPFGMEMVTVIASAQPLWSQARPTAERATPYLAELRQALSAETTDSATTAAYCFITTTEREK